MRGYDAHPLFCPGWPGSLAKRIEWILRPSCSQKASNCESVASLGIFEIKTCAGGRAGRQGRRAR